MKTLCGFTVLFVIQFSLAAARDYSALANAAMSPEENFTPVLFVDDGGRIQNKPGEVGWVGCSTDDPWYHPYVDIFRGADGGWDIYHTVDPSVPMPGMGEIDAHVGSPDPNIPFALEDTPGDLFILGDHRTPYYAGKVDASDTEEDFVYIHRFQVGSSLIRLHGFPEEYVVAEATNQENGVAGAAIFLVARGTDDMIAFVEGVDPVSLDPSGDHFVYATAPSPVPTTSGISQLGTGGINVFGRIAMSPSGEIYQTFLSSGPPLAGEEGSGSFYLVKWDSEGNRQWIRRHGVAVDQENFGEMPFNILATEGYVYIVGHTKGGLGGPPPVQGENNSSIGVVMKFDSDGELLLVRRLIPEGENGNVWSVAVDDNEEYLYVCGGTSDNGLNLPHSSPFIAKLRQDDLAVVEQTVIVSGTSIHPGGPYYSQVSNEAIARMVFHREADSTPYIYVGGYASQGNFLGGEPGLTDSWIMKLDTDLNPVWHDSFAGSPSNQYPWDIATDNEGNVYILGQTFAAMDGEPSHGLGDGYLRKYSSNGILQWVRLVGTAESDDLHAMHVTGEEIYLVGATRGSMDGTVNRGWTDSFVVRMDKGGATTGTYQFGTEQIDYPRDIILRDDMLYIGGITEGSLVRQSSGGVDVFIATIPASALDEVSSTDQWVFY